MAKISPLMILPPAIFAGLAGLFAVGMFRDNIGELPSTFVGQTAPDIQAIPLADLPSFDSMDLADGNVKIVNFFASWCPPCRAEHPLLLDLQAEGVLIFGVNNKDDSADALAFLDELGNPYAGITVDANGRQSIDWGVVALPETFVIDGDGTVVLKFPGPINQAVESHIRPALIEAATH